MAKYRFGDIVNEVKEKVDRNNNPYDFFIAGDHMDTDELHLLRRGKFVESDVGPAFIRIFKPGQVLYGSRRTYLRKVAVADFEGVTANTTFVLETKDESVLLQRLLPFIMQSTRFTQYSIEQSKGSTNPYVLFSDLCDYEVDLPELDEQRKLADLLWAMDNLRMSYKRLIEETDNLVKSQFIEMFGNPIMNEKEWPIKHIRDLYTLISRGKQPSYVENSKIRVINQACVFWDTFKLENVKYHDEKNYKKKLELYPGYILINSTGTGTLGRCNVFPDLSDGYSYIADSHVTVLGGSEEINPCFFKQFFQQEDVQKKVYAECVNGSTNQIELSKENLADMSMIIPPMSLQKKFENFAQQSDKSKFELEQALKELTATYKRIIDENLN